MIQIVQIKPPKLSNPNLTYVKDTYVVQNGLLFDYYPIKTKPLILDKVFSIEVSPPLLQDGYVCIDKEIYKVSANDLMKRKVYANKQYSTTKTTTITEQQFVSNKPESKSNEVPGIEIDKDADLAWENQIDSLLQNITSKTGERWEVSYNP